MEKHTENRTRTEQASEDLIELIRQKNYTPGDKLPTEAELSELLQVGRNTVREALRLLVSRNIVVIRQGSGTFLSEKQGVSDDPFNKPCIFTCCIIKTVLRKIGNHTERIPVNPPFHKPPNN